MLKQPWHFTSMKNCGAGKGRSVSRRPTRCPRPSQKDAYRVGALHKALPLVLRLLQLSWRVQKIDITGEHLFAARRRQSDKGIRNRVHRRRARRPRGGYVFRVQAPQCPGCALQVRAGAPFSHGGAGSAVSKRRGSSESRSATIPCPALHGSGARPIWRISGVSLGLAM
jgi:hypothetical protein